MRLAAPSFHYITADTPKKNDVGASPGKRTDELVYLVLQGYWRFI